jgi:hypothetical protein
MEFVQKDRIIIRFLTEISDSPITELQEYDVQSYTELGNLLDYIDLHQDGLFNLETLEIDPDQWREFCGIIKYSSTIEANSPPVLKNINLNKAEEGIKYTRNAHDIIALPKDDYYTRPISIKPQIDAELNHLITMCRTKLYALTQSFPETTPFDASSSTQVINSIRSLQDQIGQLTENTPEFERVQKKLDIFLDLNNLTELKQISVPQDNGSEHLYCTLAETIAGVTEKLSLVSLASVKTQLNHLCTCSESLNLDSYTRDREYYKLSTQAIIKLPKYGDVKEVQREAIALNISRLLGLDTAITTSISYNGHPGLFVQFDNIRLLSDFSSGKIFSAWLSGKNYTHYSTIKPVGEGIQADCFINDFGNALGLLYLCSDTDAIGGMCQNKALRKAKSLFIFDQIMMDVHKFVLDSRICLIPNEFFKKHTRHGLGRNRTIIEDSLLSTKFDSIMQLKAKSNKIVQYVSHVVWQHHHRIVQIQKQLREILSDDEKNMLSTELNDLLLLEKDVETLKIRIQERLAALDTVLPQTSLDLDSTDIKQALIFEKLMHNPILFSDDGRPYKNPWTKRHANNVQKIDMLDNGYVQLTFSDKVSTTMVDFIKYHGGGDSININTYRTITLSKEHLHALKEDLLHPEHRLTLEPNSNYIDPIDIGIIKEAYNTGYRNYIIKAIDIYRAEMQRNTATTVEKMKCISETEEKLKEYIATAKDKGFGMHLIKKFNFDIQKHLQNLMAPLGIPTNLNDAFTAALKLDRISEFNMVVFEAVEQKKITDKHFLAFLNQCIQSANAATNYTEAQNESLTLSTMAKETIQQLQALTIPLPIRFLALKTQNDEFIYTDDSISANEDDLEEQHNSLTSEPSVILPTLSSSVMLENVPQESMIRSYS